MSTTPAVASVTMNHSDAQQRITVTGVGFAASGNEVTVGGASCTVETESATSVVCAPPTTLGVTTRYTYYDVLLRADDIGYANMPSSSSDSCSASATFCENIKAQIPRWSVSASVITPRTSGTRETQPV